MLKVLTIVGARPQFIKAAALSRLINSEEWNNRITEKIIHTGQHYDDKMSEIFFRELRIPKPNVNLGIGGMSHGRMTGEMLIKIEDHLQSEKPDVVILYGDTNSTLAGALAAAKMNIPVAHIEAGLRSFWKRMPEEQNRVLTDHLSSFLFCPTETATNNLNKEGIIDGVFNVGDIMLDANIYYRKILESEENNGVERLSKISNLNSKVVENGYILATIHRAENTNDPEKLGEIITALNEMDYNVVLPLHPRTRKAVDQNNYSFNEHITVIEPVGFFDMLSLEVHSNLIITDSGGVQKEAYFIKKPCITVRDQTEWVETVQSGWNMITGAFSEKIKNAEQNFKIPDKHPDFFGEGDSSAKILSILCKNR
jgi:UDP-GlcNAc3NAcA epimerase